MAWNAFGDAGDAENGRRRTGETPNRGSAAALVAGGRRHSQTAPDPDLFPETDCVRDLLPHRIIAAAERRAQSIGLGADRVLICAHAITEEAYLTALAASLGTSYERLDRVSRADCPLHDDELIMAAAAGLLPLRERGGLVWIVAPRALTARQLADRRYQRPAALASIRFASSERLNAFVARHAQRALGRRATGTLHRLDPSLSNAPRQSGPALALAAAVFAGGVAFLTAAPWTAVEAAGALLCTVFLAAAALRLFSAFFTGQVPAPRPRVSDDALPVYTVICPLYREAGVIDNLVGAIRAFDYPPEKLDVKLVLEPDDRETREALARLDPGPPFSVVIAPPSGPKTKPKALNAALAFAQGSFTVIYDAEDIPEPDQLRRAFDMFAAGDKRLACVQASLTIDNPGDSWLARMFTASYAGQFDAFLPGLATLRLPFPLGGSSNHFRTDVLRRVGGWDPYNVTEDADLGIRLYRFGYRSAALSSATYEEAPVRFWPWLRQRTRWYKGWMQTWLVHMRHPWRLVRELSVTGAAAFQLFLACNVLAALIHPLFMIGLCVSVFAATPFDPIAATPVFAAVFLYGYLSTIALDAIGLARRGLLAHVWVLALTPFYWFLLSFAAWRALFQLLSDPQGWEKTEHGLARSSRLAGMDG